MVIPDSLLYLLYSINVVVGLLLGGFLYREFHEGFMVVIRGRVLSLKWGVVSFLLLGAALNLFWLYKVRALQEDLVLLLLMFSGMVAPFVWMAAVAVGRFLLFDVVMGFLGEVSDSFAGIHQQLQQWLRQHDLEEAHQHDNRMDKIRKVRRRWTSRLISRKEAVSEIAQIKGKPTRRKRKRTAQSNASGAEAESMPGLMSGFVDKVLQEKRKR